MLLARGSSDNVAVYGRYHASVDYRGCLVVALSQSGATPEIVETADRMRRAGAVVIGIANEPGSPRTRCAT